MRLFADLFDADIIVASPIGLATRLAEDAAAGRGPDYLSSIELLVVERGDALAMQNWAHVTTARFWGWGFGGLGLGV